MDDPTLCTCGCHAPGASLFHIVACCVPCPACGARVQYHRTREHAARCPRALDAVVAYASPVPLDAAGMPEAG